MNRLTLSGLLLAGVAAMAALFWAVTGVTDARIVAARADLARLEGEAAGLTARIAEFRAAGEAAALPDALMLPGAARAEVVLGLQERIVALAAAHGIALTAFGEASAPEGLSHPAVAVTVEGEGRMDGVAGFMAALEGQSPPLGLAQVMLRPTDAEGGLSLRLSVWGFLRRDGEAG